MNFIDQGERTLVLDRTTRQIFESKDNNALFNSENFILNAN